MRQATPPSGATRRLVDATTVVLVVLLNGQEGLVVYDTVVLAIAGFQTILPLAPALVAVNGQRKFGMPLQRPQEFLHPQD